MAAYRTAMQAIGEEERILSSDDTQGDLLLGGRELVKKLLASGERFTALYAVKDMLAIGAAGALAGYQPPLVVIDMGTATTMIAVDRDRNFLGGSIMPGMRMSLSALASETSMLYGISLDVPKHAIGRGTVDAMRSGIVLGHAAMIDGLLDRMEEEMGEPLTAVATGGLASSVVPVCSHRIILDNTLVLTGLKAIYDRNTR